MDHTFWIYFSRLYRLIHNTYVLNPLCLQFWCFQLKNTLSGFFLPCFKQGTRCSKSFLPPLPMLVAWKTHFINSFFPVASNVPDVPNPLHLPTWCLGLGKHTFCVLSLLLQTMHQMFQIFFISPPDACNWENTLSGFFFFSTHAYNAPDVLNF